MLKEKLQKIVDIVKVNEEGNNKRKIENLVVFVVLLIITVIMINTIWNNDSKKEELPEIDTSKVLAGVTSSEKTYEDNSSTLNLEERLKNILSKMDGVGKVDVLITYSESSKMLAMYNEDTTSNDTEEKDTRRSEIEK